MEPMACAASGEPIPEGSAYITDADGKTYLPEHYVAEAEGVADEPEPKKAARK